MDKGRKTTRKWSFWGHFWLQDLLTPTEGINGDVIPNVRPSGPCFGSVFPHFASIFPNWGLFPLILGLFHPVLGLFPPILDLFPPMLGFISQFGGCFPPESQIPPQMALKSPKSTPK